MNNTIQFYNSNPAEIIAKMGVWDSNSGLSSVPSESPIDAIDIILNMAKSGKIDPWDVDIVKVYDEYMIRLAEINANNNLKLVGRAFVFASYLLNLKSKVLSGLSLADFEPDYEDFDDFGDGFLDPDFEPRQMQLPSSNVISFDEVLQRRTSVRLNRNRSVTLNDLIRHLEFYEELERKRALQNALDRQKTRAKRYTRLSTSDILDMTQDDYMEELVQKLEHNLNAVLKDGKRIELNELSVIGFSRTSAFMAILVLSSQRKFDIVQEEFYGDLYVTLPNDKNVEESNAS